MAIGCILTEVMPVRTERPGWEQECSVAMKRRANQPRVNGALLRMLNAFHPILILLSLYLCALWTWRPASAWEVPSPQTAPSSTLHPLPPCCPSLPPAPTPDHLFLSSSSLGPSASECPWFPGHLPTRPQLRSLWAAPAGLSWRPRSPDRATSPADCQETGERTEKHPGPKSVPQSHLSVPETWVTLSLLALWTYSKCENKEFGFTTHSPLMAVGAGERGERAEASILAAARTEQRGRREKDMQNT